MRCTVECIAFFIVKNVKELERFRVNNFVFHRQAAEDAKNIDALYAHNILACALWRCKNPPAGGHLHFIDGD